jgi:hypothetical protein
MENNSTNNRNELTAAMASLYAVPLADATTSIGNFKRLIQSPTKAFTIHAGDFLGAIGYTQEQIVAITTANPLPFSHARIYLGANSVNNRATELKLFLVPVRGAQINPNYPVVAGTDQIPTGAFESYPNSPIQQGQFVFDLIAPCPGTCDLTSPLNNAVN